MRAFFLLSKFATFCKKAQRKITIRGKLRPRLLKLILSEGTTFKISWENSNSLREFPQESGGTARSSGPHQLEE